MYIIRYRKTGIEIEEAKTYGEAFTIVMKYENDYTENCYEVIEKE